MGRDGSWELEAGSRKTEAGSWETEDRNEVEANLHFAGFNNRPKLRDVKSKTKKPVCQKLKTAFLSELGFIGLRDFKMVSCLEIVLHTEEGS